MLFNKLLSLIIESLIFKHLLLLHSYTVLYFLGVFIIFRVINQSISLFFDKSLINL